MGKAALSSLTGAMNWYPVWKSSIFVGFSGIVAKRLADSSNVLRYDVGFTDVLGRRPQESHRCVNETFRVFHEITEYVKSPGQRGRTRVLRGQSQCVKVSSRNGGKSSLRTIASLGDA